MANALEVNANELIKRVAHQLKEHKFVHPPVWAGIVKTGRHVERPPMETDWWYTRSAAILRSVYKLGPIGTSKLRTKYGGRKNRGYRPEHFFRGGGSIIRKSLQQLEASGLISKVQVAKHNGRKLTPKGKSFIDKIASLIAREHFPVHKKAAKAAVVAAEE